MLVELRTPEELSVELGRRCRALRLEKNWRRATLAERAGISVSTLARFETTGVIALAKFVRLAWALGRLDDLETVLQSAPAATLADLERHDARPPKHRGRV
jgi:transcriptional regulator with XRE-family HTH domain